MYKTDVAIFKAKPFTLISTIVMILILLLLGTWQLKRLGAKNNFISSIENNIQNTARPVIKLTEGVNLYEKITLRGRFIDGENIFLYGRRSSMPEKNGYYLLSTFKTVSEEVVLVSRAWLSQTAKDKLLTATNFSQLQNNSEEITGFILPGEKKTFLVPENDYRQNIWFNIDLKMAKKLFNINFDHFYLMQIDNDHLPPGGRALSGQNLSKIRNDHLEYAITWYSLAACLLIIFFIYHKPKK